MTDAKIVDIKGVQWNLKDEVARNKIIELENNLIAQDLEDIAINLKQGYTANERKITQHYKVGKIHFMNVLLRDISGIGIGTTSTATFGSINIIPKKITSFLLNDYISNTILRCYIEKDGSISIGESKGVAQGNNICLGELIFAEE